MMGTVPKPRKPSPIVGLFSYLHFHHGFPNIDDTRTILSAKRHSSCLIVSYSMSDVALSSLFRSILSWLIHVQVRAPHTEAEGTAFLVRHDDYKHWRQRLSKMTSSPRCDVYPSILESIVCFSNTTMDRQSIGLGLGLIVVAILE